MDTPTEIWSHFREALEHKEKFPVACFDHCDFVRKSLMVRPESWGCESWRSHTLSLAKKRDGEANDAPFLLIIRMLDEKKRPVVCFVPGATPEQAWMELCYRAADEQLKWKDDEQRQPAKRPSFMDAITSTKE